MVYNRFSQPQVQSSKYIEAIPEKIDTAATPLYEKARRKSKNALVETTEITNTEHA